MKFLTLAFLSLALFAGAADMTDFDGDGLPDVWEAAFGFRTNSAVGVDGPYGDQDGDGLNNFAEYRAGYYEIGANIYSNFDWAIPGLNPTNARSVTVGVYDAFIRPAGTNVTLRWLMTDHDFLEDSWETTNAVCSVDTYDNRLDMYGMPAFSRCRQSAAKVASTFSATLYYRGLNKTSVAPILLQFYSDPSMDKDPDATARISNNTDWSRPLLTAITNYTSGFIRGTTNYVFAFMDLNNDNNWDAGEACGVAYPFATSVGWDRNRLQIQLSDTSQYYPRISFDPAVTAEDIYWGTGLSKSTSAFSSKTIRIRIIRTLTGSSSSYEESLFDGYVRFPRRSLHEGDFLKSGIFGLDYGWVGVPPADNSTRTAYNVLFGNDLVRTNNIVASITNYYGDSTSSITSTPAYPIGGTHVLTPKVTFRWKNNSFLSGPVAIADHREPSAFAFEMKQISSNGVAVLQTGAFAPPPTDQTTGEYVWECPVYMGDPFAGSEIVSNNCTYAWRVAPLNPKFHLAYSTVAWTTWNTFFWGVPSGTRKTGYGEIRCNVGYAGASENRGVRIESFDNRGFSGAPEARLFAGASASITNMALLETNLVIIGVSPGNHYIRAYLDNNTNAVLDAGEPWGYANSFGATQEYPFTPLAVRTTEGGAVPSVTVIIEDTDDDNNRIPD